MINFITGLGIGFGVILGMAIGIFAVLYVWHEYVVPWGNKRFMK